MDEPLWTGVGVALVTLFTADSEVDLEATAEHAARLVDLGVRAVLVTGTTGEAAALTDTERVSLVTAVRQACPRVPLVAGASGDWWPSAVARAAAAVAAGADALLVAPPRGATDLVDFYTRVAKAAGDAAVFAYHYPRVAGAEVPVAALAGLPVHALKDSSGDPERLLLELDAWDGATYLGAAQLTAYARLVGAAGVILAAANAAPEDCLAAWNGDGAAQRRLMGAHLASRDRFPHGLKELTGRRFGTAVHSRMG